MAEAESITHYARLGIATDASVEEIRRAYRALAKVEHPDAGGDAAAFRLVIEAYECLTDADRRREYDLRIGVSVVRPGAGGSGAGEGFFRGWTGRRGDFTGNVGFPSWMNDFTDSQWEPPPDGEPRETEYSRARRERGASAAGPGTGPADVLWWWPDRAIAPPVLGGALLIAATASAVVALDPLSGAEAWRATVHATIVAAPVVATATTVTWTDDGVIHAFDLGTGALRWERVVGDPATAALRSTGRTVVGARADGSIFCFDPASGKAVWASKVAGPTVETMAIANDIAVMTTGETIEAVDVRKGRHRWNVSTKYSALPPALTDDNVWLASGADLGSLARMDLATGKVEGTVPLGTAIAGMAADGSRLVATAAGPSRMVVLDEFGRVSLSVDTDHVCPEPAVGAFALHLVDPTGAVLSFDRITGELTRRVSLPFEPAGPAQLAGERLVLMDQSGRIWSVAT